jgi:hypothetical protein
MGPPRWGIAAPLVRIHIPDVAHLLEELRAQHDHVGGRSERLAAGEVADALQAEAVLGHDLDDVEGGPAHVVAEHVELREWRGGGWSGGG